MANSDGSNDDHGDYTYSASKILPGGTLTGTIGGTGDIDMFFAYLEPGLLYRVILTPLSGTPQFDARLLAGTTSVPATGNPLVLSGAFPVWTGAYIAVDSLTGPATYSLRVEQVADDFTNTIEERGNGNGNGTGTLALGGTATGRIDAPNDVDWFSVDLKAGQGYRFSASGADVTLIARDSSGHAPYYLPADGSFYSALYDGPYFVEVSGKQVGNYVLSAVALTDDYPAEGRAQIAAGGSLDGRIDGLADVDGFEVTAAAGRKLAIVVTERGQAPASPAGPPHYFAEVVDTWATYRGYGSAGFMALPVSKGDPVYVKVSGNISGDYTVTALDVTGDTTAPVLLNAQDATLAASDALRLRFDEPAGVVTAEYGYAVQQMELTVTDGGGTQVGYYPQLDDRVQWEGRDLVLKPGQAWHAGETYTLSFKDVDFVDYAGNVLHPADLRFHVAGTALKGTSGNDRIAAATGPTSVDGGAGIDAVVYGGTAGERAVKAQLDGSFAVTAAGAQPDTLVNVERVLFSGQKDALALDVDAGEIGGQAYRLYQAAFDRTPDNVGVAFWMNALEHGVTLHDVAAGFIASNEFQQLYGTNASDTEFANRLYQNVLHRAPDEGGIAFWIDALHKGVSRADVLAAFGESPENVGAVAQVIGNGFVYTPYA